MIISDIMHAGKKPGHSAKALHLVSNPSEEAEGDPSLAHPIACALEQ
jgi:hypothetical protein